MRKPTASVLLAFLALAPSASPQEKSDKFAVFVTGLDDAAPVAQSLITQMNATKPFEAVGQKDPSKVIVLVSCMARKQTEPFACMYVSHYNGPSFKPGFPFLLPIGGYYTPVAPVDPLVEIPFNESSTRPSIEHEFGFKRLTLFAFDRQNES